MHAPISLPAMQLGKHVQCQKPLTHTVHEARQMRLAAKKYNVVTQMGNQIQSHEAYRTAVKLVHDGVIGKVNEVHSWQSGAMGWMLVDDRPAGSQTGAGNAALGRLAGVAPSGRTCRRSTTRSTGGPGRLLQRPTRRLRLPHPRPGVHGAEADRAAYDHGRGPADQPRSLDEVVDRRVRVPGTTDRRQDDQGHLVRRRRKIPAARSLGLPRGLCVPAPARS